MLEEGLESLALRPVSVSGSSAPYGRSRPTGLLADLSTPLSKQIGTSAAGPFQETLGTRLDTQSANEARRLSASRTIPRTAPQARRGTRRTFTTRPASAVTRVPVVQMPRMSDCIDASDPNNLVIRLTVKVYPSCVRR